jgi:hypothetical protein
VVCLVNVLSYKRKRKPKPGRRRLKAQAEKALDLECFERNNFFQGQLLTADDFKTEQEYFLLKHRLINRLLHGSGVVAGLLFDKNPREGYINLSEGLALDEEGREIVVPEKRIFNLDAYCNAADAAKKRDLFARISYCETAIGMAPSPADMQSDSRQPPSTPSRVVEGFKVNFSWTLDQVEEGVVLSRISVKETGGKIAVLEVDNSATINGTEHRTKVPNNRELFELLKKVT